MSTPASLEKYGGRVHYLSDVHHYKWDKSLEPALTVASGDVVVMKCREAFDDQFQPDSTLATVESLDWDRVHSLTGPVVVSDAEPGDVLSVEILDFTHQGWGYTVIYPGFGLLPEDFGDTCHLQLWNIGNDGRAELKSGIRVPIDPFCGVIGVALADSGAHPTMPPRHVGGNIDTRHLTKGSTLYLPVEVPGALFSAGDGHLAQGDGEVCGLAIESPLTVTVRLSVLKNRSIASFEYDTPAPTTSKYDGMGYHVTTAAGADLQENCKNAVRHMIEFLTKEYGLSRIEAYVLCSVAADLKIAVPVLGPGHASLVTYHLPHSIFFE
jgi:acetamidase/formamidase